MPAAEPSEYRALVVAALVLVVVLVMSFMCIQLYKLRKPAPCPPGDSERLAPEGFSAGFRYTPYCGGDAPWLRAACLGNTAGAMPSIETEGWGLGRLCCGSLGVPP